MAQDLHRRIVDLTSICHQDQHFDTLFSYFFSLLALENVAVKHIAKESNALSHRIVTIICLRQRVAIT